MSVASGDDAWLAPKGAVRADGGAVGIGRVWEAPRGAVWAGGEAASVDAGPNWSAVSGARAEGAGDGVAGAGKCGVVEVGEGAGGVVHKLSVHGAGARAEVVAGAADGREMEMRERMRCALRPRRPFPLPVPPVPCALHTQHATVGAHPQPKDTHSDTGSHASPRAL